MIKIRIERILLTVIFVILLGVLYHTFSLYSESRQKDETLSVSEAKIKAADSTVVSLQIEVDSLEAVIAYKVTSDSVTGIVIAKQKKVIRTLLNELDSAKIAIDTLTAQEANDFVIGYYGVPKDSIYLGAGIGNIIATDLREHDLMERIIPIMEVYIRSAEGALSAKDQIILDMKATLALKDRQIGALQDGSKQKDVNNAILKENNIDLRKQVRKQKIQKYTLLGASGILLLFAL